MSVRTKNFLWIGLTGGIASGKSSVSSELEQWAQVAVIDADAIARDLLSLNSEAYYLVIKQFGSDILMKDQNIDRLKLGKQVFADKQKLLRLESILHPRVQNEVQKLKNEFIGQGKKFIFYDVPLLFEKNLESQFDLTVSVLVNPEIQVSRMKTFRGYSEQEAKIRIQNQLPNEYKQKKSNYVILNEGTRSELSVKVQELIRFLELKISDS